MKQQEEYAKNFMNKGILASIAKCACQKFDEQPVECLKDHIHEVEFSEEGNNDYVFKLSLNNRNNLEHIYVDCYKLTVPEKEMFLANAVKSAYRIIDNHSWKQGLKYRNIWTSVYMCPLMENVEEVILPPLFVRFDLEQKFPGGNTFEKGTIYYVIFLYLKEGEEIQNDFFDLNHVKIQYVQ